LPDLAFGIEEIAEFSSSGRTDFHTGWIPPSSHAINAKRALRDNTNGPRPITKIMDIGIHFVRSDLGLGPVKKPRAIGASRHTHSAADTPIVVNDNYSVRFGPGGMGRTDFGAWGLTAVLALNGYVCSSRFGDFRRIVIEPRVNKIDPLRGIDFRNPYVVDLRIPGGIVFLNAGILAPAAPSAPGNIEGVTKEDAWNRGGGINLKFFSELL